MAGWTLGDHIKAIDRASQDLAGHGFPVHGGSGFWETETGHHFRVDRDPEGNWELSAGHAGDPDLSLVHVHLGPGDDDIGGKVSRVFRDREFMGHLGDQYNRARLNNNPTGYDFDAQRVTTHRSPDTDVFMDRSR
jgi:hypothetical protein